MGDQRSAQSSGRCRGDRLRLSSPPAAAAGLVIRARARYAGHGAKPVGGFTRRYRPSTRRAPELHRRGPRDQVGMGGCRCRVGSGARRRRRTRSCRAGWLGHRRRGRRLPPVRWCQLARPQPRPRCERHLGRGGGRRTECRPGCRRGHRPRPVLGDPRRRGWSGCGYAFPPTPSYGSDHRGRHLVLPDGTWRGGAPCLAALDAQCSGETMSCGRLLQFPPLPELLIFFAGRP